MLDRALRLSQYKEDLESGVAALLSPASGDRVKADIYQNATGLTKVRLRVILIEPEHGGEGGSASPPSAP